MFSDGLDSAPADVVAAAAARITAAARAALAAAAAGRPADAAFASRVLQAAGFDRGWYVPSESLAAALVAAFAAVDGLAAELRRGVTVRAG